MKLFYKLIKCTLILLSLLYSVRAFSNHWESELRATIQEIHYDNAINKRLDDIFLANSLDVFESLTDGRVSDNARIPMYQLFLHKLVTKGKSREVRRLLGLAKKWEILEKVINFQRPGGTFLHLAVIQGELPITQALLKYGIDVSLLNSHQQTALQVAVKYLHIIQKTKSNYDKEVDKRMKIARLIFDKEKNLQNQMSESLQNPTDLKSLIEVLSQYLENNSKKKKCPDSFDVS